MEIGVDASRAFRERATGIGVYATEVISRLIPDPPGPLRLYLDRPTPPPAAPPLAPGSEWRCLPLARGWTVLRLNWELRRHPPRLLFVPAYRLPPGRVPRAVVTVHGVEHRFAPDAYPGQRAQAVESFVVDTLRRAARVITPSETTKADLVNLYGADAERVTVIPHGIAAGLRPLSAAEAAPALARLEVGQPYFLVVGAHHPRKNVPFLVEQFAAAFPGAGPELPRLVVTNAEGEAGAGLLRRAAELGVGDRVQTLPHVAGEQLAALISGALAVCVPSLYEGFGLPALEAMACGAAVIASDAGGVQEVATGAALLLGPADAEAWVEGLRRLAGEPELRQHLGRLGVSRAAAYSWERSAAQHRQLLQAELALAG